MTRSVFAMQWPFETCLTFILCVHDISLQSLCIHLYAEAERRKKEEAERKAKLDEIAEKQRQRERELEERERIRREAILGKSSDSLPRHVTGASDSATTVAPIAATVDAAAAREPSPAQASAPTKYVPRFRRSESNGKPEAPEPDRWADNRSDDRSRPGDRWRPDNRPTSFGGSSRPVWLSSRR